MTSLMKRLYNPAFLDVMFLVLAVICSLGLFRMSAVPIDAIVPPDAPMLKALALVALAVASGIFATWTTRLDQKCADDYMFQSLTKSALMAIVAFMVTFVAWNALLAGPLGRLASYSTLALLLDCWAICYFIVRIRGTRA